MIGLEELFELSNLSAVGNEDKRSKISRMSNWTAEGAMGSGRLEDT